MKYCKNCGAELAEGLKFCEACGAPIEETSQEKHAPPEEPMTEGNRMPSETGQQTQEESKPKKRITILIVVIAVIVVLGIAGVVLWQTGVFEPKTKPASTQTVQAVDKENLYGMLDWKENQDKTYEAKNSLIKGNSDANLKEIFEESAYFTSKEFKYATDGKTEYHLVNCRYKKSDKEIPYAVVFRMNKDKHLELAELQKNGKKVEQKDFESFLNDLYKTKEDVGKKETAKSKNSPAKQEDYYFKPGVEYNFGGEIPDGLGTIYLILNKDNSISVRLMVSGDGEYDYGNMLFVNDRAGDSTDNHIFANQEYICYELEYSLKIVPNNEDDPQNPYVLVWTDPMYGDSYFYEHFMI